MAGKENKKNPLVHMRNSKKKFETHYHCERLEREQRLESKFSEQLLTWSGPCPVPMRWALPAGHHQGHPSNGALWGAAQTQWSPRSGWAWVPPQKCGPTLHTQAHTQPAPTPDPILPSMVPGTKGNIRHGSTVFEKEKKPYILLFC